MDPFSSINNIYSLVCKEEKQQKTHVSHFLSEGATLATQNKTYSKVHQFNGNYDDRKKSNNKPTCKHCDKEGYTKTVCYKLYGYPPKWQEPS